MGIRELFLMLSVLSYVYAQSFRVCIPSSNPSLCQSLDLGGSLAICVPVESRVECAIKLSRSEADFGVFSEEELLLLGKQQPNDHRVVASVRDEAKLNDLYAFEAVAVVRNTHAGGMEGLHGGRYCHPGFDQSDLRWSPRVLKTLEYAAARTHQCPNVDANFKTADELEVENLSTFFASACRPGPWSSDATVDAELKHRFPNLCSLCANSSCAAGYTTEPSFAVNIAGVNTANRHIQALECLRTTGTVAYVAWQHVRDFFNSIRPEELTAGYALLCEDGSLQPLTAQSVANSTAACSLVKQPWGAIVASTTKATEVAAALRSWWPGGVNPGGNTWQSRVYSIIGGASARVVFEESTTLPTNYTSFRPIQDLDASSPCLPARRWCTISALEQTKCQWLRQAAYTLGIQPTISCQLRASVFDCLKDIKGNSADFIATPSNYGFLARKHYQLSPVKLVQNSRSNPNGFSRIAAFIRTTAAQEGNITRFENLRGTKACFPEFGGIAYVAFVRTAHERSVISDKECDYGRAVGEFFGGACAPGALDAEHVLYDASTFNSSVLCDACRPANATSNNLSYTCAWDHSNLYYGNEGSLRCLADRSGDVAFVEMQNIASELSATTGLQASDLRALCRNNSLAVLPGVNIDENCLLAYTVNSEILARRQDSATNSVNVLLEALDATFGYNTVEATQLINIEIYSPFDGTSDLLFKDSAVGLSEPSAAAANEQSRNYIELFSHLEACTGAAAPVGLASRNVHSAIAMLLMTMLARFVIY